LLTLVNEPFQRKGFAGYAALGITGIMPRAGLCRI
jgi:hypothetical protein